MFRLLCVEQNPVQCVAAESGSQARSDVAIGFARSTEEALAQAHACDMVLVSAKLPDNRALEIVRAVSQAMPDVRILVKDLAESHQAPAPYMEAGAAGWLL